MISIDINAHPPGPGEPLIAVGPLEERPDTEPGSGDGFTWRWFTQRGYPVAYIYPTVGWDQDAADVEPDPDKKEAAGTIKPYGYAAEISNEIDGRGVSGLIVGHGRPALKFTQPEMFDCRPLTFCEVKVEVDAALESVGWTIVERAEEEEE